MCHGLAIALNVSLAPTCLVNMSDLVSADVPLNIDIPLQTFTLFAASRHTTRGFLVPMHGVVHLDVAVFRPL